MSAALDRSPVAADEAERPALLRLDRLLERGADGGSTLVGPNGETIELPSSAFRLLHGLVHHLARGRAVSLVPVDKEMTTQQAADILNVSRPYLVQLLDEGVIPHSKTGRHHRVRFDDLMAFKERRDAERRTALRELTQLNQELGLYR